MIQAPPHEYRPPRLPTYAERKAEKERQLAIAAGKDVADDGTGGAENATYHMPSSSSSPFPLPSVASPNNAAPPRPPWDRPPFGPVIDNPSNNNINRRPLPQPVHAHQINRATTPIHSPSLPQTVSAPRSLHHFASHANLARDRQRSLPQPSAPLRSMPSLPQMQQRVDHQVPPLPLSNASFTYGSSDKSLSRQISTPPLSGRNARPLPTPSGRPTLSSIPSSATHPAPFPPSSTAPSAVPPLSSDYGLLDRSNTASSVKSLDRYILAHSTQPQCSPRLASTTSGNVRGRPLPPPPGVGRNGGGGVVSERSMDREERRGGVMRISESGTMQEGGVGERCGVEGLTAETGMGNGAAVPVVGSPVTFAVGTPKGSTHTQLGQDCTSTPIGPPSATHSPSPSISAIGDSEIPAIPTISFPGATDDGDADLPIPRARSPLPLPPPSGCANVPSIEINIPQDVQEPTAASPAICAPRGAESANSVISIPVISFPDATEPDIKAAPPAPQPIGPGIFCSGCRLPILGSVINAAGSRWHPDCLRCTTCQVGLEHVSRYEHEGKPYCHMDYFEQFGRKCHHCKTPIMDQRYIAIDDPSLGQRFYHELHFFCGECGTPFLDPSRSSSAGTETRRKSWDGGEDDQTAAYVIHGRHAFCPECDIKLHRTKCKGCKMPIRDEEEALEALKGKWHQKCFKCASCQQPIPSEYFVPINRKPYCQDCYERT